MNNLKLISLESIIEIVIHMRGFSFLLSIYHIIYSIHYYFNQ